MRSTLHVKLGVATDLAVRDAGDHLGVDPSRGPDEDVAELSACRLISGVCL